MRVVALVPGGVGDQILFFPTLDDLKRNYPDAEIDVVVEPRSKGAYRVSKSVRDVIPFDFNARNSPADWANLLGILRDRDYEAVVSLESSWGVGLLLWLSGIATRVGYTGSGNLFLTHSVPLESNQYAAAMYHDLLQGFGINTSCPDLSITIPSSDLDWAEMEQKRLGVSGYVMIYPGSSELSRQQGIDKLYSVENWQRIVQDFQKRQPDLSIVVAQDPEDAEIVSRLTQACPTLKVTKPGDIGRLAAMIAGANLMLCTDSAPMHLAVALQVFTLAMFGPTDPKLLLPQRDRFLAIQSPTGKLADLTPELVLEKVWGG